MRRLHIEWYGASENAFGNNIRAKEGDTQSMTHRGEMGQRFLHTLCKKFMDTVESAQTDNRLTEEGKRDRIQETARNLLAELKQNWRRILDPITTAYKCRSTAQALRPPTDAVQAVQRMQIQQHMASIYTKQRVEIFQKALSDNDEMTLSVFFDKPTLFKLLDPEYIQKSKREYLSKVAPEALASEEAGSILSYNIEKIVDDLSLYAGQSNDAVEILSSLPKLDWNFEKTADTKSMATGVFPGKLPQPASAMSDGQRLEAMKQAGKKI